MKVRDKVSGQSFTVYGIYWVDAQPHFYCFPRRSTGLSSYAQDEVEVEDSRVDGEFEFVRTAQGFSAVVHRHLLANNMLDKLLEQDPAAYGKFCQLIGHEP